jgi:RNA polymerase sigma-70 factor, ECF subfamily
VTVAAEPALIERAKQGDREAFAELYAPIERPVAAFLYRMVAVRQDAADLAQETAVCALESIADFPGATFQQAVSFRVWIFRRAAEVALEYLANARRWDPDTLLQAFKRAAERASMRRQLVKLHKSASHTTYDIREHIDFCFTCMSRTLPPQETAALLLAGVNGFSSEEAAQISSVSTEVFRFRFGQGRQTLAEHYDERCSLINKDGTCSECANLHTLLYADRRSTEQALFQLEIEQHATPAARAATFERRLAIVRAIDPLHAAGSKLHDQFLTLTREISGY